MLNIFKYYFLLKKLKTLFKKRHTKKPSIIFIAKRKNMFLFFADGEKFFVFWYRNL